MITSGIQLPHFYGSQCSCKNRFEIFFKLCESICQSVHALIVRCRHLMVCRCCIYIPDQLAFWVAVSVCLQLQLKMDYRTIVTANAKRITHEAVLPLANLHRLQMAPVSRTMSYLYRDIDRFLLSILMLSCIAYNMLIHSVIFSSDFPCFQQNTKVWSGVYRGCG